MLYLYKSVSLFFTGHEPFFSTLHLVEEGSNAVANSALQEELIKTRNELYIAKSDLERTDFNKKVMLGQLNNAFLEIKGLKSKVGSFNNMLGRLVSQSLGVRA